MRGGHERISVLMPARDAAATVEAAVRTTLRALPRESQLLVHDDASSDGTGAVLASVEDPRLRVLRSDSARGVAGGLNHLLEQVDSDVVARMDADDVCLPWRFALQLRALRAGADVVFSTVVGTGDVGRAPVRVAPPLPLPADAFALHLLVANPVAHSTMLGRTDVLRGAGGYRPAPAEDYDLWLRLAAAGHRLTRIGTPCVLYRFHGGQLTASADWAQRSASDPALREAYAALSQHLLGREPVWYGDLRGDGVGEDGPARIEQFTRAVTTAARDLPALQRRFLTAKLQRLPGRAP